MEKKKHISHKDKSLLMKKTSYCLQNKASFHLAVILTTWSIALNYYILKRLKINIYHWTSDNGFCPVWPVFFLEHWQSILLLVLLKPRDVINHGAPPPQPVIRYLRAKLPPNRQSQPNNAGHKDARPCFYGDYLCCRDHDYNSWTQCRLQSLWTWQEVVNFRCLMC